MINDADIGTPTDSADGFISRFFGGGETAGRPTVSVQSVSVVSLTVGTIQNKFLWASVIVDYTCTGLQCPDGEGPTTRKDQFELQCVAGGWTDSQLSQTTAALQKILASLQPTSE